MKYYLRLLALLLIFGAVMALLGPVTIRAVGAPSDNVTMPDFPTGDQAHDVIKPLVPYTVRGPTSQSANATPNVVAGLVLSPGQDKSRIGEQDTWYLDVDINQPGWLYIYEYYPGGGKSPGQWITYKWQLLQSGLWRFGPFAPAANEIEGQHIYRIWLYSAGKWTGEGPDTRQQNLVYWTFIKKSALPVLPQSPAAAEENTFLQTMRDFIVQPLGLVLSLLLLAVIVVLIIFVYRRRYGGWNPIPETASPPVAEKAELVSGESPQASAIARITLPNGVEIPVTSGSRVIGRGDLARALGLDELGLISRRQFEIKQEDKQFYIEDLGSANGTRLNGEDIGGKGAVTLSDDDIIEPSGAIRLRFYIVNPVKPITG